MALATQVVARAVVACATALPAQVALVRLAGDDAFLIAARLDLGKIPRIVRRFPGPRTATGCDTVEWRVPGAPDVVEAVIAGVIAAGAEPAAPGAFTRLAVARGRLSVDQALGVLALTQAADARAAAMALARLRGALMQELEPLRQRFIGVRAQVEAGLDFLDEADVKSYDPARLQQIIRAARDQVRGFQRAADAVGNIPSVVLVGPANAGKSALFVALTGAQALVSPIAGTTRDWLEADWILASGRRVRLIDTAGWLAEASGLDRQGVDVGWERVAGAVAILVCSAPDAPAAAVLPPALHGLPVLRIATKADLGLLPGPLPGPSSGLAVSVISGAGLGDLAKLVQSRLGDPAADPRQERLLAEAQGILARLSERFGEDAELADDLRRICDLLGEILGGTTSDEVLDAIFSRFCIGK